MDLLHTEFKRLFSSAMHKNLRLSLAEMSLSKDFVTGTGGDLYPLLARSTDAVEWVEGHRYGVKAGEATRFITRFFPYATYELSADVATGHAGFSFYLNDTCAHVCFTRDAFLYTCGEASEQHALPCKASFLTAAVGCRPGAFDIYLAEAGGWRHFVTVKEAGFARSHAYASFVSAKAALTLGEGASVRAVSAYLDNGVAIADMRPIRYEDGSVMTKGGRVYLTASLRMQEEAYQGVVSWVPGTQEFALTGAIFYDAGDGLWASDVAASIFYHRERREWLLWVCSFAHDHILGHAAFTGDPRFGVNVIDITLMEKAKEGTSPTEFLGFFGDEDPDFFYDAARGEYLFSVCRLDPESKQYRYYFFAGDDPFAGYRHIGTGYLGAETGGSFVRVEDALYFLCGNDFTRTSDYRIYHAEGMDVAHFDLPDGGFRGWGTLIPVKMGSRTRYFWLTFDRMGGSDYRWSYGNLYCFEAP